MSAFLIPALSTEQALVLAPGQDTLPLVLDSPFHHLLGLSRTEMAASRGLEAADRRLLTQHFVDTFQWATVYPMLPLRLVVPPDVPPWRPRRCRSYYRWLPPPQNYSAEDLKGLDDFDLVLRLFDFSPWRPILAQRFRSHMGSPPFDPLTLGLSALLARWKGWNWPTLLRELHSPERGGSYRLRLGFVAGDLPCESTFRMAIHNSDASWVQLCADSLALASWPMVSYRPARPSQRTRRNGA